MAAPCNIVRINKDGSCDVIYCHYDGYPTGGGLVPLENSNTRNKVGKLFEKGLNVVSIGETLRKTEFYENKKITHEKSFKNFLEKFNSPESELLYTFFWDSRKEKWFCYDGVKQRTYKSFHHAISDFVKNCW